MISGLKTHGSRYRKNSRNEIGSDRHFSYFESVALLTLKEMAKTLGIQGFFVLEI